MSWQSFNQIFRKHIDNVTIYFVWNILEYKPLTFYFGSKTHFIFIGISDEYAKGEINAWNDMVLRYEMLTKPIDPDQLTRQKANVVYQELMKSISKITKRDKFYVDYVEEVLKT